MRYCKGMGLLNADNRDLYSILDFMLLIVLLVIILNILMYILILLLRIIELQYLRMSIFSVCKKTIFASIYNVRWDGFG